MRLSSTHFWRGFLLTLAVCLLLGMTPVAQAQSGTPNAPPPGEQEVLRQIFEYVKTASASDASTVNYTVVLLGILNIGIIVLVFAGIRSFGKPFLDLVKKSEDRADAALQSETSMRVLKDASDDKANEYRAKTAESQRITAVELGKVATSTERTVTILSDIETKAQAQQRTDNAVVEIITKVNTHMDETTKATQETLAKAAEQVEQAAKTIGDVVTKSDLTNELRPIREELHDIAVTLRKKGDTDADDASSVPDSDPAAKPPDTPTHS